MIRVGIVTWYKNGNFGGTLQSFAMQEVYKSLGCEVEFIDYTEGKLPFLRCVKSLCKLIALFFINKDILKTRVLLHNFVRKYLCESKPLVTTSDLHTYCEKFDVVSCGSDQIWAVHPNIKKINTFYYLSFVPDYKRIAYAPSIGLSYIPLEHQKEFSQLVSDIPFLSVREEEGARLIHSLTNRKAEVVLDPCLLLTKNQWNSFISSEPLIEEEYVLNYFLADKDEYVDFSNVLSEACKFKNIYVQIKRQGVFSEGVFAVDPFNFIRLIRDAKYVLTDSFHGLLFALIFNKEVGVFFRFNEDDELNQNSRINNLIGLLKLDSIIINKNKSGLSVQSFCSEAKSIDYVYINETLDRKRKQSFSFLKTSIEKITNK